MTDESTLDKDVLEMKPGEIFEEDRSIIAGAIRREFGVGKQFYLAHFDGSGQVTDLEIKEITEDKVYLKIVRHRSGKACPAYGEGGLGPGTNLCGYNERPCQLEDGLGAEHCDIYRWMGRLG